MSENGEFGRENGFGNGGGGGGGGRRYRDDEFVKIPSQRCMNCANAHVIRDCPLNLCK